MEVADAKADRQHAARRARRWNPARLARLARKELREVLRDRRTLVTLVLMPLIVYPLLSMIFHKVLLSGYGAGGVIEYSVALESERDAELIWDLLEEGEQALQQDTPRPKPTESEKEAEEAKASGGASTTAPEVPESAEMAGAHELPDAAPLVPQIELRLVPYQAVNVPREVAEGAFTIGLRVRRNEDAELAGGKIPIECEIILRRGSPAGEAAAEYVQRRLNALNRSYLRSRLRELGDSGSVPADVTRTPVGEAEGMAFSLSTVVPLILIMMTITGAVYPAIDTTAGERERGTLETLIAAPVPRLALLAAKYVAVLTVASLTATVNLAAMSATLLSTGLGRLLVGEDGISPLVVLQVFALMLLFAALFSAVLLVLSSFARSFKEAQAYLIPLMLASIAPGVLSLTPGIELTGLLAVTPLVNIVLLARDLLEGQAAVLPATLVVLTTCMYAFLALAAAARIFGADAILYGSPGSLSDMFRRRQRVAEAPSPAAALFSLAVIFPLYVYATGFLAQGQADDAAWLIASGLLTGLIFGGVPLLFARLERVRLGGGLQIRQAKPLHYAAALVLGLTLWPLAQEIALLGRKLGLMTLPEEFVQEVLRRVDVWQELPLVLPLTALAVMPAIFEELYFRGYLFAALRKRFSPPATICITAIVFGAFHVLIAGAVPATERLLPSTFLGIFLGILCYITRSILPGMLLHACHNGLLITATRYRDRLEQLAWLDSPDEHVPAVLLAGSVAGLLLALAMLWLAERVSWSSRFGVSS